MPEHLVYVGTYTEPSRLRTVPASSATPVMGMAGPTGSEGIYVYRQDPATGDLALLHTITGVLNPSFLTFDSAHRYLFAVNESLVNDVQETGTATSFAIDAATGSLRPINTQPTGGGNPCHLATDATGHFLLVANHEQGRIGVLRISDDGRLGPLSDVHQHVTTDPTGRRQPHAHFVLPTPDGRFILGTDTGTDQVLIYRLDTATGKLSLNDPPWGTTHEGAGPRHLAFHPSGRFLYANGEADMTLTAFAYDGVRGALEPIHYVPTLPVGAGGGHNSTAQMVVHPSGRFAYVSNRGHDSIAIFSIDQQTGRAAPVGHESTRGVMPRNFNVDPAGRFLYAANQNSDTVVCFRVDGSTGRLSATGHVVAVPAPTCVLFSPT